MTDIRLRPLCANDVPERIMDKIIPEPNSGCWLFIGCQNRTGYGVISVRGHTSRLAHRILYEICVGPIPAGLQLDHKCRVRCCVNPAHLEPVTNRENTMRGIRPLQMRVRHKDMTHCYRGHPFSGDNLHLTKLGRRRCHACMRILYHRHKHKRKAATRTAP